MKFELNEEQTALKTTVQHFLGTHQGESALQKIITDGHEFDSGTWKLLADQIGAQGLSIADEFGGGGASAVETTVVLEEMGRRCYAGPYFSNLVATNALTTIGGSQAAGYLEEIVSGAAIFTFAVVDAGASWYATSFDTEATKTDNGYAISGTKKYVTDPAVATHILVAASTDSGPSLFVVRRDAEGLTVEVDNGLDPTRELGHVVLDNVTGQLLGDEGSAGDALTQMADIAAHSLAAEMIGGATECLDRAVAWATARIQFGRPIGSFQAIKTKCADVLLEVETARVLVYYAAYCLSVQHDDTAMLISLAKQAATDCFVQASAELIQILGAIGFTWEHPAHLYFKRSRANAVLLQDRNFHLDRVADLICD